MENRLNMSKLFDLDCGNEVDRIVGGLRDLAGRRFRRRGAVIGLSGGVDSSVCAALAAKAFGPERVCALLLPERHSSNQSSRLGQEVAEGLGIRPIPQDISPTLEAVGCYSAQEQAIKRLIPEFTADWKFKIVLGDKGKGGFRYFNLVLQNPDGEYRTVRLPHREYLQLVAATNYKQRVRKMIEYFHADRLNYIVVGTPNRLEYDQGFFVKNGDGAADVKPIAHLYKTQVYALAAHLELPEEVRNAPPTTDTYSLNQGQDEFYFELPYHQMDMALWALDNDIPSERLAEIINVSTEIAEEVYRNITAKRRMASYLHEAPVTFGEELQSNDGTTSLLA